jgi:hypothetical protein
VIARTARFKLVLLAAVLGAAVTALLVAPLASASEFDNYGIESVNAEETDSRAGQHPDVSLSFVLNHKTNGGQYILAARTKSLSVDLPPGLIGDPTAVPVCTNLQYPLCPTDSQVGVVKGLLDRNEESETFTEPLFNMEPANRKGAIARFGFVAKVYPEFVDVSVRTGSDYGATATIHDSTGQGPLVKAETILWGVPASSAHDAQRMTFIEALYCGFPCFTPEGSRASGLREVPFVYNPTACEDQPVRLWATSYQLPGEMFTGNASLPHVTECDKPPFAPSFQVEPTNRNAGAPTGLHAVLRIPQTGSVNLPASSALRDVKVVLPEGMTVNAAAANGLEACSNEQVALGREVASACPAGSKIGTVTVGSPALPEAIHGEVYQRTPADGDLFRIWVVTDEYGLHLKLPGEIKLDEHTGRLTAEFTDLPQLPVEEVDLELRGGARAPLKNPDSCGEFSADYELTPWAQLAPVSRSSEAFSVDGGCGHGFAPELEAGVANPVAGKFSPLIVNLNRQESDANVSALEFTLPKGELAKLKGVPLCPEAAAAAATCPDASRIGSAAVSVGAGSEPLWVPQPGKPAPGIFLSGPYGGAPYSAVTEVSAQAGPFDLGTVTVRGALFVDPRTTQVTFRSDALPQILKGVPVLYRTIHIAVDRDEFALNPTNCEELSAQATVKSVSGQVATPGDDFQVGDCAALGFHPTLKLKLAGGTSRGKYPTLTAVVKTHKKEANFRRVSVALPHSEFLAQEHINTVCTRVQFAAANCPKGSVYGYATVTTPLLANPLRGPVYLRSSDHPLPDLVMALGGELAVELVGKIDSVNGGIRTTFTGLPDAPVTKVVLRMKGGKQGLIVNSTDICGRSKHAVVKLSAQNGRTRRLHPKLQAKCAR